MNLAPFLATHLQYTIWATSRTLESVRGVSPEEWTRHQGDSIGGLRPTMIHLLNADLFFQMLLAGQPVDRSRYWRPKDATVFPSFDGFEAAHLGVLEGYAPFVAALSGPDAEAFAAEPVEFFGAPCPRWQVAATSVNHATYHRGQVANLLRQLGRPAMSTDLPRFYFERDGKAFPN